MKRVLIAEDDMVGRNLVERFLGGHATCRMAVDGLEAIGLFAESIQGKDPYDLIFLDIMMPQLDGLKVLKAIRDMEARKRIPEKDRIKAIMITALNDQKTVMESYELGCVGFAWKPIDLKKLSNVLREIGFYEPDKEES